MACPECEKNKKKTAKDFTKAVVEIKNPDKLVLFRKVVVPASMGTEEQFPASVGKFSNVLLQYEANGDTYLYSSDGIPTQLSSDVSELQRQLDELKVVVTNEIADRIAADGTINSRIDQEILDRQAADNDLSDALAAEVAARKAADNTLDGKITAEKNARIAADNTLQTNINNEATARAAADNTLDGKITTEKEAREAADNTLDGKITAEATARANADTALGTRITNETTARQNADNTLDGKITTEANTRSAADSALAEDISAEVTRAKAAETALGGRIDDEATTRAAADTTLDGKITAEATARANADSTLDGKITDEATTRANADTALGTRITNETTARTNADTAINNKLNRTVLYDLEMQTDANNVTFVEDKVNLGTGATTTERDVIPAASRTTAGTISASEYISLVDAEEKITALLEGAVAIDNLPANPTQQQLTNAWLAATGKTELINRASIYDSANQLVHTYYTNVSEWEDSPAGGQITIDQFTNSAAGIIKGSTTDGNVSANLDGTGTVSGWTALKNTVAGKANSSDLATVATSGSYNDLSNKPTIPTVNNATLTIQKNGTNVQTFTANSSTNKTANITVPTKTSELTNDSNFPVDANYVHTDNNFTTTLKNKLDGIAAGAEVNQNAFSNVKVGGTTIAADTKTDTLELVAGSNITLTPDATNDKVTIASTDTNTTYTFANGTNGFTVTPSGGSAQTVTVTPSIANATTSTAGLMSAADKTELDKESRVDRRLIADGTSIPEFADLNTITYLSVGRYVCGGDARAVNLVNCPTTKAFAMEVFNATAATLDNETTSTWIYRVRRIRDREGNEWTQRASSGGTAGSFTYGDWMKTAHTSDLPTVNNATLTIQKNGTNVQTFTANSSTNKTANITVPTKVTDLTDATNYVAKDGDFYVTGEGSNFSMTGTSQNVYADLKVKGDTQQATYTGKNKVNLNAFVKGRVDGGTIGYADGTDSITVSGNSITFVTNAAFRGVVSGLIAVQPSSSVTFNGSSTGSDVRIYMDMYTSSSTWISRSSINDVSSSGWPCSATVADNCAYVRISFQKGTAGTATLSNLQLEAGSTATAFEPYVGGVPAPNPDYPQEVEVVTGRQVISSCGKNLFDKDNPNMLTAYIDITQSIITSNNINRIVWIPCEPNTTYTVQRLSPPSWHRGLAWTETEPGVGVQTYGYVQGNASTLTITTGATAKYLVYRFYQSNSDSSTTLDNVLASVQIEKGPTATSYEPYLGKEYEVNLGKNIFNKEHINNLHAWFLSDSATFQYYTAADVSAYIPAEPNTTYTASKTKGDRFSFGSSELEPAGGVAITRAVTNNNASSLTITTGPNDHYLAVFVRSINSQDSYEDVLATLQIEKGSTATSYAPYFTPIELCKIDTYQDYIYPSGDKWYLHKETGKITYNGSENWEYEAQTYYIDSFPGKAYQTFDANTPLAMSPYFRWGGGNSSIFKFGNFWYTTTGTRLRVEKDENPNSTTLASFKTWLASNQLNVYYVATSTDTEITNPLLIAQLNDLWRNLQSGTNTTNVNVEGDLPAILGVTAFTNTLASAMAGINERMNRLPAIPEITMTTTDPGEGQTLADNHYVAVYQ